MAVSPIIPYVTLVIFPFFICFGLSLAIIFFNKKLILRENRQPHWIHKSTIPRHGGVVFLLSLVGCAYVLNPDYERFGFWMLISAIPMFLAGSFEDLVYPISPKVRIICSILSGVSALLLFEYQITSLKVPGLDWLLTFSIFGIVITLFATTTLAQAYNLIDGLNGLSSGCGLIALTFIFLLAFQNGDHEIYSFCLMTLGCLLGFWFLNFFSGRIFLGDSGAYLIGHLVAWNSIIMSNKFVTVSPWAFLLATAYPVIEILITVVRRVYLKRSVTAPDSDHFHHFVNKVFERQFNFSTCANNSLSSLAILVGQLGCMLFALRFKHHSLACFLVFSFLTIVCLSSCLYSIRRHEGQQS